MGSCPIILSIPPCLSSLIRKLDSSKVAPNVSFIIDVVDDAKDVDSSEKQKLNIDESMLQCISDNFFWLLEQFEDDVIQDETTYAAPKVKIVSKIGYLYGIKSNYIRNPEQDFQKIANDIDDLTNLVTGLDELTDDSDSSMCDQPMNYKDSKKSDLEDIKFIRNRDSKRGLENSSDDESETSSTTSSIENVGGGKRTRKVKPKWSPMKEYENIPDFTKSLCFNYFKPKSPYRIDVSDIEKEIFRQCRLKKYTNLDKVLLRALEQSDMLNYVRLVNSVLKKYHATTKYDVALMLTWKSWLINGTNLCFYGAGSKMQLMNAFMNAALRDGHCFTINAYRATGTGFDLLWSCLRVNLFNNKLQMTRKQIIETAVEKIKQNRRPFYIIIYGIDVFLLNNGFEEIKPLLSLKNVYIVGYMDHLRSSLLLHSLDTYLGHFRLVFANTGLDYKNELIAYWDKHPPKFIIDEQAEINATELTAVLMALSQNHRKLFSLIARIQIESIKPDVKFLGIDKARILRDPRAATICNNESKLDSLLTEFTTHNIIEQTRGAAGKQYLRIPFNKLSFNPHL
ncbi:Origin recognition complex [Babesia duncani]|uniref:Origin recognition complex subunit 2 n=1 Tax=Babesia duncani TaxID=323732 RepID=A0AAD9PM12_9APIC|nr:Origin recognition complex [Babesia duncani]